MINSILINEYILKMLNTNESLVAMAKDRIFPIDAQMGTEFPFIVMNRGSIQTSYCKDGAYDDSVSVTVTVVASTYKDSVKLANEVRRALEKKRYEDDDIYISDIKLTNVYESFYNDAYIQQLDFSCSVQ